MLKIIVENSGASVSELARTFSVTPATVRSDLSYLEGKRLVVRTHGGAIARQGLDEEPLLAERKHAAEKSAIAANALPLVKSGEVIALDTGTTMTTFAQALVASPLANLTLISPDIQALSILEARSDFSLISVGGKIRSGFHFACGAMALDILNNLRADACVLSTTSLDFEQGLTTPDVDTARIKQKLLEISRESILLVDSSKLGHVSCGHFASLEQVDHLVIDAGASETALAQLRQRVPDVIVAR
ncbi:MAG: DeoR/GlpR family DNA-binding transcription regulator [Tractidigestivibacter sp.]|uniref:DeoR/GlpR family DNA-binding transcription regulator n=1 Tax=Tractidigestivibacter sp. TaxID=2847320 RepID=UPI003D8E8261